MPQNPGPQLTATSPGATPWLTWSRLGWLNLILFVLAAIYLGEIAWQRMEAVQAAQEAARRLVWQQAGSASQREASALAPTWERLRQARGQVMLLSLQLMLAALAWALLGLRWLRQKRGAGSAPWGRARDLGQLLLAGGLLSGHLAPAFSLPFLALAWLLRLAGGLVVHRPGS